MDAIKTILTRRSVRNFKKDEVPQELITQVVECALHAPSSKNSQPWKILVIKDPLKIKEIGNILVNSTNQEAEPSDPNTGKIKEGYFSSIKASGEIINNAPILIIVENTCPFSGGRSNVMNSSFRNNAINGHDSEFLSLGAALENICLAAYALGLATVIIADVVAEEKKIKNLLNLKGDLVAALPLGYPEYQPPPKKTKEGLIEYL